MIESTGWGVHTESIGDGLLDSAGQEGSVDYGEDFAWDETLALPEEVVELEADGGI